jgi:hypothetical protein
MEIKTINEGSFFGIDAEVYRFLFDSYSDADLKSSLDFHPTMSYSRKNKDMQAAFPASISHLYSFILLKSLLTRLLDGVVTIHGI